MFSETNSSDKLIIKKSNLKSSIYNSARPKTLSQERIPSGFIRKFSFFCLKLRDFNKKIFNEIDARLLKKVSIDIEYGLWEDENIQFNTLKFEDIPRYENM